MRHSSLISLSRLNVITFVLMLALTLSSCNYVKNVDLLTSGRLDRENFVQTIPFKMVKDLVVIDVRINDEEQPRPFILDTGAFESKIEIGLAEQLNLPAKATKTNSTAQGVSQTIEVTQLSKVTIGETTFKNISAGKLRYDDASASRCIAEFGIIGANLMKLAHWKIDYHKQEIHFSDKPFKPTSEKVYSLRFNKPVLSGTPEIELEVAGKTVSGVMFDVGYNGGLILPDWFSDYFPGQNERLYFDRSTSGIFGTNTDTLTSKLLDVSLGGFDMTIPVEFSSIGKALLGNDVLEHFVVLIDYDKKRIHLQPQSYVDVDEPYAFIPGILNDSLWVVNRTTSELPFALGDTLQSIDMYGPSDLYDSFCDYFLNINTLINSDSLHIVRKDSSVITISTNL